MTKMQQTIEARAQIIGGSSKATTHIIARYSVIQPQKQTRQVLLLPDPFRSFPQSIPKQCHHSNFFVSEARFACADHFAPPEFFNLMKVHHADHVFSLPCLPLSFAHYPSSCVFYVTANLYYLASIHFQHCLDPSKNDTYPPPFKSIPSMLISTKSHIYIYPNPYLSFKPNSRFNS